MQIYQIYEQLQPSKVYLYETFSEKLYYKGFFYIYFYYSIIFIWL